MALTDEQRRLRDGERGRVTASFAPYLMAGDEAKIFAEWQRLVGAPDYQPEDLSDKWPVQLGSYLEPFALDWHERRTRHRLTRRGEVVTHPDLPHVCCTLDAWRNNDRAAIDCKVIGHWRKLDDACRFYTPQMIVQRACTKADRAALLVVHGGAEPQEYPIEWTVDYEAEVWARVEWFWGCVLNLESPVDYEIDAAPAPTPPIREEDFGTNNVWCIEAAAWLEHRLDAKRFQSAEKTLKQLIAGDVKRGYGAGIEIVRDRAGRLSIKELR